MDHVDLECEEAEAENAEGNVNCFTYRFDRGELIIIYHNCRSMSAQHQLAIKHNNFGGTGLF